jgi:hypothetical protein
MTFERVLVSSLIESVSSLRELASSLADSVSVLMGSCWSEVRHNCSETHNHDDGGEEEDGAGTAVFGTWGEENGLLIAPQSLLDGMFRVECWKGDANL